MLSHCTTLSWMSMCESFQPISTKREWQNCFDFIWNYVDVTKILWLRQYPQQVELFQLSDFGGQKEKSGKALKSLISELCSHIFPMGEMFLCLFTQRSIWLVLSWTLSDNSRLTSPAIIVPTLWKWTLALSSHVTMSKAVPSASQSCVHITCTSLLPTFMGIQPTKEHENMGIKHTFTELLLVS